MLTNRCRRNAVDSATTGFGDEAGTSHSFPKLPLWEPEETTVITITTGSQTTDAEESTYKEGSISETAEVTEVDAPPPTAATSRTLSAQTPMPTSRLGCSAGRCAKGECRGESQLRLDIVYTVLPHRQ